MMTATEIYRIIFYLLYFFYSEHAIIFSFNLSVFQLANGWLPTRYSVFNIMTNRSTYYGYLGKSYLFSLGFITNKMYITGTTRGEKKRNSENFAWILWQQRMNVLTDLAIEQDAGFHKRQRQFVFVICLRTAQEYPRLANYQSWLSCTHIM